MKKIVADYLDLCLKFRKDFLSKLERKQRHAHLMEWAKKQYADNYLTIPELYEFWDRYQNISYNKVFIEKVIVPSVNMDMRNGGIEGLKFLFYCLRGRDAVSYRCSDSPVSIFCNAHEYKYSSFQLADMVLEKEPDNEDALKVKYFIRKEILWYSIHEIPLGVLNGLDGASPTDIPPMLNSVDEFQDISNKLKIDNDEILIEDCRKFYTAYGEYLKQLNRYDNFEDYLNQHDISYERYCSTYYYKDNKQDNQ